MTPNVYVSEVDALARFRSALADFGARTIDRIVEVKAGLAELDRWIADREQHWENEIRSRSNTVNSLDAALRDCMSAPEPRPCHHIAADLTHAQSDLRDAEEALRCCRAWLTRISEAGADFRRAAAMMESAVDGPLTQGVSMLRRAHKDVQDYLSNTTRRTVP